MRSYFTKLCLLVILLCLLCDLVISTAQWHTAGDGHKYLIDAELKFNWLQANDECARRNLQLVDIDNEAKNQNLIAVIRSAYGTTREFWLGFHDEFSAEKNTKRPFFSVSRGEKLTYSNWRSGEPNNLNNAEHCVLMWTGGNFQWNDRYCEERKWGFICEEHHLTVKYQKDLKGKRSTANQKNTQLATKFTSTQAEINKINSNAKNEADRVFVDLEQSSQEIIADLKKSLYEIVKNNPYLEAVIADVGKAFNEIVLEKEQEFAQVSSEARQSMETILQGVENSSNAENTKFSEELARNANEIDMLFVY